MVLGDTFQILNIVIIRKAKNRDGIPHVRSARKENLKVKVTVESSDFTLI